MHRREVDIIGVFSRHCDSELSSDVLILSALKPIVLAAVRSCLLTNPNEVLAGGEVSVKLRSIPGPVLAHLPKRRSDKKLAVLHPKT